MVEYRNLGWPFFVVVLSALWICHLNVSWPPLFLKSAYNCIIVPWILWVIFLLLPSRFSLLSLTLNVLTITCVGAAFLYFLIWGHWASCNYKLIYVLNFKKQFIIIFGNVFLSLPLSFSSWCQLDHIVLFTCLWRSFVHFSLIYFYFCHSGCTVFLKLYSS